MRKRFHNLKRPKVRADWSKWTLYNISSTSQGPSSIARNKTFFQQKWHAKAMTRAYHGEQIREGQWSRMFDRRLPAVVSMEHSLLARTDGSEQAAGRGSGLDAADRARQKRLIPYMHMTYWPTERRLDTAIWRSLFASSVRQARQFVVHGSVTVNGKKMRYPGYLLNPGDLFAVEPERVLYATGARKFSKDSPESLQDKAPKSVVEPEDEGTIQAEEDIDEATAESDEGSGEKAEIETLAADAPEEAPEEPSVALRSLLSQARSILRDSRSRDSLSGKRKEELRSFSRMTKQTLSRFKCTELRSPSSESAPIEETVDSLQETLATVIAKITPLKLEDVENQGDDNIKRDYNFDAKRDAELLHRALERVQENPLDVSKPYATPWQPREFMSAFAFIPRYLEVHHKICSAVYLRHPVARPGLAEVPTPFNSEIMQLAHNWYLRRR